MKPPKRSVAVIGNRVHEFIDFRGTQELPARPAELPCDYCHAITTTLFCRPVRAFGAILGHREDGCRMEFVQDDPTHWNACASCEIDLFEPGGVRMVNRMCIGHTGEVFPGRRDFVQNLLFAVLSAMDQTAPVIIWTAGSPFPPVAAPVTAEEAITQ